MTETAKRDLMPLTVTQCCHSILSILTMGGVFARGSSNRSWFLLRTIPKKRIFQVDLLVSAVRIRTTAAGEEVIAAADLSSAGVAGVGNIGAVGSDVALGTVNITNDGADDDTVEFRIFASSSADPILGFGESSLTQSFTLSGSGGGGIDPFVLLGDLTQDGFINFPDFLILSANFGLVKNPAAAASVPEPSSALLLLIGGLALLRRRRR